MDRTVAMELNASSATRMAPASSFCMRFDSAQTSAP